MKILFCKISSMKYYKGHCDLDIPYNGGKYVQENGYGHEEFNFYPMQMEDCDELECLGFAEPKSNHGYRNTFHIEKIEGCAALKDEPFVEDVLVVWCATRDRGDLKSDTTVVGWYKHATVWRDLQEWTMVTESGEEDDRYYNVRALAADCTLLPEGERNQYIWSVPKANYTKTYGFGQAMVWYPTQPEAQPYIEKLVGNIESYRGENWLDIGPDIKQ